MRDQKFIKISKSCVIDSDYKEGFSELGLNSIDAIFSFNSGRNLAKKNLARYRTRLEFEIKSPVVTVFLKRYDKPPVLTQLRSWLAAHGRLSCAAFSLKSAYELSTAGINTPKTLFYGEQWGTFFEKRSFIITEKISDAESLERKSPDFFDGPATVEKLKLRRNFIVQLASFIRKFHETDYRHRDLYLSHIFYSNSGDFFLIDLARAFKPIIRRHRFRIKDLAQLYYSAPAKDFPKTDRLRFYFTYIGRENKLTGKDKTFIRKVINKVKWMAKHEIKYGREAPFKS